MRFMFILKATRESEAGIRPGGKLLAEMARYHDELLRAGVLLDASALQSSAVGWRVRYSGRKRTVIGGPFAGTDELIAGYAVVEVKSREEALEWARRFPNPAIDGKEAEVEVRELRRLDDFEPGGAAGR